MIIKRLNVNTYGSYNFYLSSLAVFQLIALNPLINIFDRYLPEIHKDGDFNKLKKLITKGLGVSTVSFICLSLMTFAFSRQIGTFFKLPSFEENMLIFFVLTLSSFLGSIMETVCRNLLLQKQTSLISIFNSAARLICYILFLRQLSVNLLLIIESVLFLLLFFECSVVFLMFVKQGTPSLTKSVTSAVSKKRVVRYGFYSLLNGMGSGIIGRTSDSYIVSAISGPYALGLYSFSSKIYNMFYQLLPIKDFLAILQPIFIHKFTADYNKQEFINIFNFIYKVLLPIYLLPLAFFFIFGRFIIAYLFDSIYLNAYWPIVIMLLSNVTAAMFYPLTLVVVLRERMDIAMYSKGVAILSIVLGIIGMRYWGIIGVAAATTLGDFLKNIVILILMRNDTDIVYKFNELKKFGLSMAILITVFYIFGLSYSTIFSFIILSTIFMTLYFVTLLLFGPFNKYDRGMINLIFKSVGSSTGFTYLFRKIHAKEHIR